MPYYRPIAEYGAVRPASARSLAGGPVWFTRALRLDRGAPPEPVTVDAIPAAILDRLTAPRAPIAGLSLDRPRIMGILNVTPDSFSDGGRLTDLAASCAAAEALEAAGADIVDIGGESTRPGAETLPDETEIARTEPVITALASRMRVPMSIDTRKAAVARVAIAAGARLVNDVSGLTYDPAMVPLVAQGALPVCVMHAQGDPQTMQDDPVYDDVLLDVYDWLDTRVGALEAQGIPRARILVDPGIGFGKTVAHNLALLRGLSLFHGLGCGVLLGASRKGFIGRIAGVPQAQARMPGSVAVALGAVAQGVQVLRMHDVAETAQALALWRTVHEGVEFNVA